MSTLFSFCSTASGSSEKPFAEAAPEKSVTRIRAENRKEKNFFIRSVSFPGRRIHRPAVSGVVIPLSAFILQSIIRLGKKKIPKEGREMCRDERRERIRRRTAGADFGEK